MTNVQFQTVAAGANHEADGSVVANVTVHEGKVFSFRMTEQQANDLALRLQIAAVEAFGAKCERQRSTS